MFYLIFATIGLLFITGCTVAQVVKPLPHNVVPLPLQREVRIDPQFSAEWIEAITWAFDQWKAAVPQLNYRLVITNQAKPIAVFGVSSIVPADLVLPVTADTSNGYIEIDIKKNVMAQDGKRALVMHELGHLVFGFGESKDKNSIMQLPITAFHSLPEIDAENARAAFPFRDGIQEVK